MSDGQKFNTLRSAAICLALGLALSVSACGKSGEATEPAAPAELSNLYVVDHYDPERNPGADLTMAVEQATDENKRILIVVGGQWCIWCTYLADFLEAEPAVHEAFAESFLLMKVNYSPENKNTEFLERFPQSEGYPDFFILESDGSFIEQQGTAVLEKDRSYDPEKMLAFAHKWKKS